MLLYRKGQYDRAVVVAKKALDVAEKAVGPNHPSVATSLNSLAVLYEAQGQYAPVETVAGAAAVMFIGVPPFVARRIARAETPCRAKSDERSKIGMRGRNPGVNGRCEGGGLGGLNRGSGDVLDAQPPLRACAGSEPATRR